MSEAKGVLFNAGISFEDDIVGKRCLQFVSKETPMPKYIEKM